MKRHRSHRSRRNAFVASKNSRGHVMVVRDRRSGRWMLPGGMVNPGESSARGARREMWEETGNATHGPLHRVVRQGGTTLYQTRLRRGSHSDRNRRFHRRSHKNETSDYGFVDVKQKKLVVTDHGGKVKDVNPVSFRRGTASHLKSLRKRSSSQHRRSACKRLLRSCDKAPGSCFGYGFRQERLKVCGY